MKKLLFLFCFMFTLVGLTIAESVVLNDTDPPPIVKVYDVHQDYQTDLIMFDYGESCQFGIIELKNHSIDNEFSYKSPVKDVSQTKYRRARDGLSCDLRMK